MFENLVIYLVQPSSWILTLALISTAAFFLKYRILCKVCIISIAGVYLIFSFGPVSFFLLKQLEYEFKPIEYDDVSQEIQTIVMLTGYAEESISKSTSSFINRSSAFRIIETLTVDNSNTISSIIISGKQPITDITKKVLIAAGISESKVILENNSSNTFQSAKNVVELLGEKKFILVTSAGHMPRAVGVFKKMGSQPIAAPTDYLSRKNIWATPYLPNPRNFHYSDIAMREYAALFYYKLTGKM